MTTGKVRVEFRNYIERLELMDASNMMKRNETLQLFHDYLAGLNSTSGPMPLKRVGATQRITVQLPKLVTPANFDHSSS
jgi:hypothetical protein